MTISEQWSRLSVIICAINDDTPLFQKRVKQLIAFTHARYRPMLGTNLSNV